MKSAEKKFHQKVVQKLARFTYLMSEFHILHLIIYVVLVICPVRNLNNLICYTHRQVEDAWNQKRLQKKNDCVESYLRMEAWFLKHIR